MSTTDTQSYSFVLRDVIFARTVTLPFFAGFHARREKMNQISDEHVPYLGVYFIGEEMVPDGDGNAGHIKFVHTMQIGFSVIILNNDAVQAETKLDQAYWAIMNGVWRDPYITNMIDTSRHGATGPSSPDNTRFESIPRGMRKHMWGLSTLNNNLPLAELQYEAWILHRAGFEPRDFDDLLRIDVETVPLAKDGTIPSADEVQRIISKYEFTPAP